MKFYELQHFLFFCFSIFLVFSFPHARIKAVNKGYSFEDQNTIPKTDHSYTFTSNVSLEVNLLRSNSIKNIAFQNQIVTAVNNLDTIFKRNGAYMKSAIPINQLLEWYYAALNSNEKLSPESYSGTGINNLELWKGIIFPERVYGDDNLITIDEFKKLKLILTIYPLPAVSQLPVGVEDRHIVNSIFYTLLNANINKVIPIRIISAKTISSLLIAIAIKVYDNGMQYYNTNPISKDELESLFEQDSTMISRNKLETFLEKRAMTVSKDELEILFEQYSTMISKNKLETFLEKRAMTVSKDELETIFAQIDQSIPFALFYQLLENILEKEEDNLQIFKFSNTVIGGNILSFLLHCESNASAKTTFNDFLKKMMRDNALKVLNEKIIRLSDLCQISVPLIKLIYIELTKHLYINDKYRNDTHVFKKDIDALFYQIRFYTYKNISPNQYNTLINSILYPVDEDRYVFQDLIWNNSIRWHANTKNRIPCVQYKKLTLIKEFDALTEFLFIYGVPDLVHMPKKCQTIFSHFLQESRQTPQEITK